MVFVAILAQGLSVIAHLRATGFRLLSSLLLISYLHSTFHLLRKNLAIYLGVSEVLDLAFRRLAMGARALAAPRPRSSVPRISWRGRERWRGQKDDAAGAAANLLLSGMQDILFGIYHALGGDAQATLPIVLKGGAAFEAEVALDGRTDEEVFGVVAGAVDAVLPLRRR